MYCDSGIPDLHSHFWRELSLSIFLIGIKTMGFYWGETKHMILMKSLLTYCLVPVYNAVGQAAFDLYDEVNFDVFFQHQLAAELKVSHPK